MVSQFQSLIDAMKAADFRVKQQFLQYTLNALQKTMEGGRQIPQEDKESLLAYANNTYNALKRHDRAAMFPQELATPEYLAKSDLAHWLTYPTELGRLPDEIEYLGKVTRLFKKDVFYIFKYRSGSQTLSPAQRNRWLIGWSDLAGGTFSNFDLLEDYEKGSLRATLNNIKKLLG